MVGSARPAIEPRFVTVDGVDVRFAESESRDTDALLFAPWPESLFAYDRVWSQLAERHHLIAVDLPGFGHSERSDELLSPRAMGSFVNRLADEFELEQPHAVAPDIGTAAVLFAAAEQPGRLLSLVVGTGGVAVPIDLGSPLRDWVFADDLEPYRDVDPRAFVGTALDTIRGYALPEDIREDYLSGYDGDRFVESMRYVRAYPDELPALAELLADIETPVQIFAGGLDRVVPVANAEYLRERLPHNRLDILDTGHFAWEEDADEFAFMISDWWDGGYTAV
jgi:pimeloyl-ACP methyl ester carboxylesterase